MGLGMLTGRGTPMEGSLLGGDGDGTEACGGTSTKWALCPGVFPGTSNLARKAPRPPPSCVCVCVCVCVLGKVGPSPPSSATPAGWWAPGEGGSSLPQTHQPGFSSSTSTTAPTSNQWSQITFRRAGLGLG